MERRFLIRYGGASLLATVGTLCLSGLQSTLAQSSASKSRGPLTLRWLGHTCFLFSGDGTTVLVNPFKTGGCTAKYRPIKVASDLVMISSQLLDEGYVDELPGDPKLLFDPGIYRVNNLQIQGIRTDHDREGGRRFGINQTWLWTQGGIKILHLGGIAAPIALEQQILMGRPDLLLIPVGGGPKAYNPEEAKKAIDLLKPRAIIPTQYLTSAADPTSCDLVGVDALLKLMPDTPARKIGSDTLTLSSGDLPGQGSVIYVLSYKI
jgi:L-ascorbate metabolism protein UlaG (beta-lactamase superfamily)